MSFSYFSSAFLQLIKEIPVFLRSLLKRLLSTATAVDILRSIPFCRTQEESRIDNKPANNQNMISI